MWGVNDVPDDPEKHEKVSQWVLKQVLLKGIFTTLVVHKKQHNN